MKILQWFKDMLDAGNSVSSKRFCGVLGWIICLGLLIYCTIAIVQAPTIMEFFLVSIVGLLGVDSVTGIWKNSKNKINQDLDENIQ